MSDVLDLAAPWTRPMLGVGIDLAVRSSIVIVLALVLHGVLGRRRVLIRSVLWNACLLGLLALPAAVGGVPQVRVSWWPERAPAPRPEVTSVESQPVPVAVSVDLQAHAAAVVPVGDTPAVAPRAAKTTPPAARSSRRNVAPLLLLAYAIVAAVLLLRLAVSLHAVRRLTSEGAAVREGAWAEALATWSGRLGVRRPVRLVRVGRLGGPVVVGWLRPTIVLPDELARSAAPGVIDAVIVHELAHVRRGDYGWNVLLRLVQAAYWPQPLVWLLGPIVASVREQACDELCVYWTGDARGYRATLLAIAESLVKRPREVLGLAMSRPTRLGRRLAHLATTQGASRCLLRGPARGVIVLLVVAAVGLLGSIRLARSAAAQQPAPKAAPRAAEKSDPKGAPRADQAAPKPEADGGPKAKGNAEPEAKDEPAPERPILDVTVEKPRREPWVRLAQSQCTLQILNPAPVHARVAGVVSAKGLASVGDRVRKGDLLAEIEASDLPVEVGKARATLRQANSRRKQALATVAVAKATAEGARAKIDEARVAVQQAQGKLNAETRVVERVKVLARNNVVSQEEVGAANDKLRAAENEVAAAETRLKSAQAALSQAAAEQQAAEAGLDAAEADIQEAQAEVDRLEGRFGFTKVLSPIDGIVFKRNVEAGSPALPDHETPLFVVARTDVLSTDVMLDESQAALVSPGLPVLIYMAGAPGSQAIRTKVRRVAPEIQKGKLHVEIEVPNPDGRLRPGSTAAAMIALEPPHEAITVPIHLLHPDHDELGNEDWSHLVCYRVSGERAVATPVKLGLGNGSRVEIVEGLKGDESLIADLLSSGRIMSLASHSFAAQLNLPPRRVRVVDAPPRSKLSGRGMGMGGGRGMNPRIGMGAGFGGSPADFR